MAWLRLTLDVEVKDEAALARVGEEIAVKQSGFTPEQWHSYRAERCGPCCDLLEWLPHCPQGATFERVTCAPIDEAA